MSHFCFYFTCAPGPKCRVEKTSVFMVYFCVRLTLEITRADLLPRLLSRITHTEVLTSAKLCKGKPILYLLYRNGQIPWTGQWGRWQILRYFSRDNHFFKQSNILNKNVGIWKLETCLTLLGNYETGFQDKPFNSDPIRIQSKDLKNVCQLVYLSGLRKFWGDNVWDMLPLLLVYEKSGDWRLAVMWIMWSNG